MAGCPTFPLFVFLEATKYCREPIRSPTNRNCRLKHVPVIPVCFWVTNTHFLLRIPGADLICLQQAIAKFMVSSKRHDYGDAVACRVFSHVR